MQQNIYVDDDVAKERKESWETMEMNKCSDEHVWLYAKVDADGNYKRVPKFMCDWIQFSLRDYCVERDKWNLAYSKRRTNGYADRVC